MLQSKLFGNTLKETSEEVQILSHKLLLRGGFIRQLSAGVYTYLPLGFRVLEKVKKIVYEELAKEDVQHLSMPVLHPAELWQESGRWDDLDEIMYKIKNHQEQDLCLAVTHEEAISDLVRREIFSYRQLPTILHQIQLKFRDELRPRGGLLRMREFTMSDAYSFDRSEEELQQDYETMTRAYKALFKRCGLETIIVDADSGKMGGKYSHEFMILAESGEDTVITCTECDYRANQEKAVFIKDEKSLSEQEKVMEEITVTKERGLTVDSQAKYHKVEPWQILKTIIYKGDAKDFIAVMIRGDLEINETKLKNLLPYQKMELVSEEDLKKLGTVKGFVSPIKLTGKLQKIIADKSIQTVKNFLTSPNKANTDLLNVNYPRDLKVDQIADIASAKIGATCGNCKKGKLQETRGVEVAHTFKLGTRYSKPMNMKYTDEQGKEQLILMGCFGIGVDRIVAGAVEQSHDDYGIIWPENIASFQVHLIAFDIDSPEINQQAKDLYQKLQAKNIEVLFDDRNEKPGFKFKDADLIGIPLRVVISKRSLEKGGVEVKKRKEKEGKILSFKELLTIDLF